MVEQADRYLINSVLRAALILQSFSFNKTSYTNAELSKKLGLSRSTLTRLLYSLEKAGFLERDDKTGEYKLTHELYRIGTIYINKIDIHKEAMPLLYDLASSCKESVCLGILHKSEISYLGRVESSQSIVTRSLVGTKLPAYCTAIGKVILAHLEEKDLNAFFEAVELKPYTPKTITDIIQLKNHLEMIRNQGYAIGDTEHTREIKSVACPVYSNTGQVIAGVSIVGPAFRMLQKRLTKELIPALLEVSRTISERLGYQGVERQVS